MQLVNRPTSAPAEQRTVSGYVRLGENSKWATHRLEIEKSCRPPRRSASTEYRESVRRSADDLQWIKDQESWLVVPEGLLE